MSKIFTLSESLITDENIQLMRKYLANRKLMLAAKAIYFIYSAIHSLLENLPDFNRILRSNKVDVVNTIDKVRDWIGAKRAARLFGITVQQYAAWKNRLLCTSSPFGLCRKIHPQQLTRKEVSSIKNYLMNPEYFHWSAASVYYQMIREKASAMSLGTFYKYSGLLRINRNPFRKRDKTKHTGIRAGLPLEILHMDVTVFRLPDHTKVFIYIIQDNFSRAILNATVSLSCCSAIALDNLKAACRKFKLLEKRVQLITDDGSENNGEVSIFLNDQNAIQKLVAQKDIIFSNSMIEAANKRLKYDFLFRRNFTSFPHFQESLSGIIEEYNSKPVHVLTGHTPDEVLAGVMPNPERLRRMIEDAKTKRPDENRKGECRINQNGKGTCES